MELAFAGDWTVAPVWKKSRRTYTAEWSWTGLAVPSRCGDGPAVQIRAAAWQQWHAGLLVRRHQERDTRPWERRHQQGAHLRLSAMVRRLLTWKQGIPYLAAPLSLFKLANRVRVSSFDGYGNACYERTLNEYRSIPKRRAGRQIENSIGNGRSSNWIERGASELWLLW